MASTAVAMPHRVVETCMGTVFSFDVRAPGVDRRALDDVIAWLHWVDATFSTYRHDSEINRLARGEIALSGCAPEVAEVLARCAELEAETGGYFSAYAAGTLDPSGLVKGWAIQRASEMLQAAGSTNHCVNGGGDVQCVGSREAGAPWRIGIAHPLQLTDYAGIVEGHRLAVATSGTAERGEHITVPRTGRSAAALASVTIIGRELATTDAYATAAFAMGSAAPAWIASLPDHQGLVVHADGTTWSSAGQLRSAARSL
jgi:thiamine biosynthesis lipoprotein